MRHIVCEDCKKSYDFDKDEFCPKCGAFNQPVKTWGTDAQGNIVRVDGVNESGHAGSFVHKEVHQEKRVRKATGMDWGGRKQPHQPSPSPRQTPSRQPLPRQAVRPSPPPRSRQNQQVPSALKTFFWLILILVLLNFLFPLLLALFS